MYLQAPTGLYGMGPSKTKLPKCMVADLEKKDCGQIIITYFVSGSISCTADLQFVCIWFSWIATQTLATYLLVWLNPIQSNRRSAIQWYLPIHTKKVIILWLRTYKGNKLRKRPHRLRGLDLLVGCTQPRSDTSYKNWNILARNFAFTLPRIFSIFFWRQNKRFEKCSPRFCWQKRKQQDNKVLTWHGPIHGSFV